MQWIKRWLQRKQVKELKKTIAQMQREAEAAHADKLTLAAVMITDRIALLEKAVDRLEQAQQAASTVAPDKTPL